MEASTQEALRNRIRAIIRKKAGLPAESGGFLPLLSALPMVASALPSVIDAGKKLFGSGKHHAGAKTRKPNHHAMKVKHIMAQNPGMSLPQASKLAKSMK